MLLSYNDYQTHKRVVESRRQLLINIFNQFEDIRPVINEAVAIVEAGVFDMVFESEELNEETLVQRMKAKFDQAVQVAKQKGKQALSDAQEKIIKLGGSIGNVIKLMVQKLQEWIANEFKAAQATYKKFVESKASEIKAELDKKSEDTKKLIAKEVQQLKQVASSFWQWISSGFSKEVTKGAVEVAKSDMNEAFELAFLDAINEAVLTGQLDFTDMIEEGGDHGDHSGVSIPFVTTIAHKLHNVPPFSLLDKVKKGVEKVSGIFLNKVSYYATELAGAPGPFEFVAIASLVGILAEVKFKGIAKHALVHAIPGVKTVASWISNIAMAMALIGILETLTKEDGKDSKASH